MPQKVIKFSGINRSVNEFQNSGACEELINLRQKAGGGHGVVKPKKQTEQNVRYKAFYEHKFGDVNNRIIVDNNGLVIWDGGKYNEVTITNEFVGKDITISYAGNILIVYCEKEKKQKVFRFIDNAYKPYDINFNYISDAKITYGGLFETLNTVIADEVSEGSFNEALQKAASGFNQKYPHGLCGASVIGCTYELEDGNEIWSTAFIVADALKNGGVFNLDPYINKSEKSVTVHGFRNIRLVLNFDEDKSNEIRRINVYSTKQIYPYEVTVNQNSQPQATKQSLEKLNLDGQLMYYQGSIVPNKGEVGLTLHFDTTLAGDTVMDVDAGCIERVGNVISYNNRFHFYRSEVRHVIQVPTISCRTVNNESEASYWIAYVKINGKWTLINKTYRFTEGNTLDFIYPMAGVKELAFVKCEPIRYGQMIVGISCYYAEMFYVKLKDSSAYNYSYAFDVTPSVDVVGEFFREISASGQVYQENFEYDRKVFLKNEINVVNVSAPYNPFVFPVEHSYGFSGEILDVNTSYIPISSTQVSQYPLSVFTTDGIYALSQGDGSVLYGGIVPLQPMVIEGKAKSTPHGVFFVSNRNLYILSGRDSISLSSSLDGNRELSIRNTSSYKKLCCNGDGPFYDYTFALSNEDFEEFISGATLAYDEFRNELHISSGNPDKDYSYVLNLDTKTYHKVIGRYESQYKCSRYVIESKNGKRNLIDLFSEEKSDVPILLQSRPMSLEAFYTHIQRLILLADAKLDGCQHLCLSVFGSDNLNDWKCIISSQKHNTILRHIRTNRSAKSYKDYVILITGVVDSDTDISDIIADYTVINRRIG